MKLTRKRWEEELKVTEIEVVKQTSAVAEIYRPATLVALAAPKLRLRLLLSSVRPFIKSWTKPSSSLYFPPHLYSKIVVANLTLNYIEIIEDKVFFGNCTPITLTQWFSTAIVALLPLYNSFFLDRNSTKNESEWN